MAPPKIPIKERLMRNSVLDSTTGCRIWTGVVNKKGYPRITVDGRFLGAHRVSYTEFIGPIPDGLQLDHVRERGCASTSCIEPSHLEPVTNDENQKRKMKDRCKWGHLFDEENTYYRKDKVGRECRACRKSAVKRSLLSTGMN